MNKYVLIVLLFLIASANTLLNATEEQNVVIKGSNGSFTSGLAGTEWWDILIDTESDMNVQVTINYNVDSENEMAAIYEYPSYNPVISLGGVGTYTYTTTSKSGKIYIEHWGFESFCNGTLNITYKVVPDGTKNLFPNVGAVQILTNSVVPNLFIKDPQSKTMGTYSSTSSTYDNALLLMQNGSGWKLGLGPNKISSNQSFGLTTSSYLALAADYKQYFYSYGTLSMTLYNGKVAIGPVNPINTLDVSCLSSSPSVGIAASSTSMTQLGKVYSAGDFVSYTLKNDFVVKEPTGNIVFHQGSTTNDGAKYISFGDGANNRTMNVFNNGKVSIGTNTPASDAKLTVNGTIKATEVKVELLSSNNMEVSGSLSADNIKVAANGHTADFVFEEGYDLKDLAEVEKFIKANKHLPNIPSAENMEANGVDLAEMNKLLLQKVEELTLYVLQQNAMLKEKDEDIAQLQLKQNELEENLLKEIAEIKNAINK